MKLSAFTVDPEKIEAGEWIADLPDCGDLRIHTRGLGNASYKRLMQTKQAAVPRAERRAGLKPETIRKLTAECLLATCLLGWENLSDGSGAPIPYSREKAAELLLDPRYEPLLDACITAAARVGDARDEDREDAAKN